MMAVVTESEGASNSDSATATMTRRREHPPLVTASLADGIARALHQLRIAGKWLRYTLEFVREALGDDAAPLIEPVVALQDHLGDQHDLHVAATLTRDFVAKHPGLSSRERVQLESFTRRLDGRVAWHGERLPRVWRPLVGPGYRSRFGRALTRL